MEDLKKSSIKPFLAKIGVVFLVLMLSLSAAVCTSVVSEASGAKEDEETLTVYFKTNGGRCSVSEKEVVKSEKIGKLPVPTRKKYEFTGWFTQKSGGSAITEKHVVSEEKDFKLYAHWKKKKVPPANITINAKSKIISVGQSFKIKVSVLPSDATNKKVTYSSSNTSVANVSKSGKVMGLNRGSAVITVKTKLGGKKVRCKIKVSEPSNKDSLQYALFMMNEKRKQLGIGPLILDSAIKKATTIRAKELKKSYSHIRPNGKDLKSVLVQCNVSFSVAASENIYSGNISYDKAVEEWISSPWTAGFIQSGKYRKVYISRSTNKKGENFYAQILTD